MHQIVPADRRGLRQQVEAAALGERIGPPAARGSSGLEAVQQLVEGAPVAEPQPAAESEPFVLPLGTLEAVAEAAGLQWVNSDADKIAAVRAAIAAEPKPVHVPRERPPIVVIDEGPLVLVETRRDLRDLKLPFEQQSLPLQ